MARTTGGQRSSAARQLLLGIAALGSLLLAFVAQLVLLPGQVGPAAAAFALAGLLLFVAAGRWRPPQADPVPERPRGAAVGRLLGSVVLLAALGVAVYASDGLGRAWAANFDRLAPIAILALPFALVGFALLEGWSPPAVVWRALRGALRRWPETLAVLAILVLGAGLRYGAIDTYPPPRIGLSLVDEGQTGRISYQMLYGGDRPWESPWMRWSVALSFLLFGADTTTLRYPFVTFGYLMLVPYYFLARQILGVAPALLTLMLFAASRWEMTYSRIATNVVESPWVEICVFWLVYRGLAGHSRFNFVLAGAMMASEAYGYAGFRVVPLILAVAVGARAIRLGWVWLQDPTRRADVAARLRAGALAIGLTLAAFAVYVYPYVRIVMTNPRGLFLERFESSTPALTDPSRVSSDALVRQAAYVFGQFNVAGDGWGAFNPGSLPLLDGISAAFFGLGLVYALILWFRGEHAFLLAWFFATVVGGGVLASDFRAHRILGVAPALFLFAGVAMRAWLRGVTRAFGSRWRRPAIGLLTLLTAAAVWSNYDRVYNHVVNSPIARREFDSFRALTAWSLAQDAGGAYSYVLGSQSFPGIGHDLDWLSGGPPGRASIDLGDILPSRDNGDRDALYVFTPDADVLFLDSLVRHYYPAARVWRRPSDTGAYELVFARVARADVESLRGLEVRLSDGTTRRERAIDVDLPETSSGERSAEWRGAIYAPLNDVYDLRLQSARPARLEIDGEIVLDGGTEAQGTSRRVPLAAGWHDVRVHTTEGPPRRFLRLTWTYGTRGAEVVPPTNFARLERSGGLEATYADAQGRVLDRRIVPPVDMFGTGAFNERPTPALRGVQRFTGEYAGWLFIERPGTYRLRLISQAGVSDVRIEGRSVLMVDGPAGGTPIERSVSIPLEAGWMRFLARYEYAGGHTQAMRLHWTPPGGVESIILPSALSPRPPRP